MQHKCDADAAEVVRKNLEVPPAGGKAGDQVPDGYMKVKEAVEGTYECLGITCEQVGVFVAENSGMEVCTGGGSSDAALGLRASLFAALAALAAYALDATAPFPRRTKNASAVGFLADARWYERAATPRPPFPRRRRADGRDGRPPGDEPQQHMEGGVGH